MAYGDVIFNVDASEFIAAMHRIKTKVGFELHSIMRDVMALWAKDLINRTPPFGLTAAGRKVGERAVYDDLMRITYAIGDDDIDHYSDWFAKSGGTVVGHAFKDKKGVVYGTDIYTWDEDGSKIGAIHQKARSPVTGRVSQAGSFTRNIGRWKFVNRVVMPGSVRNQYVREKQSHVGKTKAGWLAAWSHFNAQASRFVKASVNTINRMDWVLRHGMMNGSFTDQFNYSTLTGKVSATNAIPWVKNTAIARLMASVARTRLRDLTPTATGEVRYVQRIERILKSEERKNLAAQFSTYKNASKMVNVFSQIYDRNSLLAEMIGKVA